MDTGRYTRSFDTQTERLAAPQRPARMWLGQPRTQTGFILPYGRGGYRHGFGGCGCSGMGAADDSGGILGSLVAVAVVVGVAYLVFSTSFGAQSEKRRPKGSYERVPGILGSR